MKVPRRYGFVRVIAWILKALAWIILILGVVGAIFGGTFMGRVFAPVISPAIVGGGTVVLSLLTAIMWFLPLYALGAVLSLLLDIEENTRALASEPAGYEVSSQPNS